MSERRLSIIEDGQFVENTPLQGDGFRLSLDQAVTAWLAEFKSVKTKRAYSDGIASFRRLLQTSGYDLGSHKHIVSLTAQAWLAKGGANDGPVSAGTYNQKRSILSSFYKYAILHEVLDDNPMQLVKSQKATPKDAAMPLDIDQVESSLSAIDRSSVEGLRDYALLSLALTTGRRASELATLTRGNISNLNSVGKKTMVIRWEHCKGDKLMIDDIRPGTQKALLAYLHKVHGAALASLSASTPIFVSFSRNTSYGKQISTQTVSDICKKYLGTSKVHTTRHTFAIGMERAGANLSDIGARLGHANLKTTSDYMVRLHSSENKYASELEKMFGI